MQHIYIALFNIRLCDLPFCTKSFFFFQSSQGEKEIVPSETVLVRIRNLFILFKMSVREISDLPEELLEYILLKVSPYSDLKATMLVCKQWLRISQGEWAILKD